MILHRYVEYPAGLHELLCNDSIISRWRWIAAGVIVNENYRRRIFGNCLTEHLTWVHQRGIQKPSRYGDVPLQPMLGVEDGDVKLFDWKILQSLSEYLMHITRTAYGHTFISLFGSHSAAELECGVHRNRSRIANSAETRECRHRLGREPPKRSMRAREDLVADSNRRVLF